MNKKTYGVTVEIGGDTTKLGSAIKEVESKTKGLQKELKGVNTLLKEDPGNKTLLSQKYELLGQSVEEAKKKLETLKSVEKQMESQMKSGQISGEQWRDYQREVEASEQKVKSLEKELKSFGSVSAQTMQETGAKVKAVGDAMTSAGASLTKNVTAPIMAAAAASTAAAADMNDSYDIVVKKTGATGDALEGLKDSVDNVYSGIAAESDTVATAIGEVNTKFGATGETLENLSTSFIKFAEINDADVNNSIDETSHLMEQWNVSADKTDEVLGLITKAGQDTGVSIDSLMQSVTSNKVMFDEMGLSLTESVNLMAQVEKNGLDASTVITGYKTAMKNATKEGKSLDDALADIIPRIKNAKDSTEAASIASELFGTKTANVMAEGIREGSLSLDGLKTDLADYGNVIDTTYGNTVDATEDAKIATQNLKLASAELGQEILTAAAPIMKDLAEILRNVAQHFASMPEPVKKCILIIAAIVAAIGPLLVIFGTLISSVGSIITGWGVLSAFMTATVVPALTTVAGVITGTVVPAIASFTVALLTNPVILIIAAIVAAIAWFAYMSEKYFGSISAGWDALTDCVAERIGEIVNWFKDVLNWIKDNWQGLLLFISNPFAGAFKLIYDNCDAFKAKIDAFVSWIKDKFSQAASFAKNLFGLSDKANDTSGWGKTTDSSGRTTGLRNGGVLYDGQALVNESASPEMITMMNGKAIVRPLNSATQKADVVNGGGEKSNSDITVVNVMKLDGKTIAKSTQKYNDVESGSTINMYGRGLPVV